MASDILEQVSSTIGAISDGLTTLYEGDSRGLDGYDNGYHEFVVPTPAWYPDSLVRSLNKSLYQKMLNSSMYVQQDGSVSKNGSTLDFYEESTAGFFGSLWNSAVTSIVSTAAGQIASITGKVDSVVNTVSSFLFDEDETTIDDMILQNNQNLFLSEQPYVVVKGIHIQEYGSQLITVIQKVLPMIKNAYEKISAKADSKDSWKTKAKDALEAGNEVLKKFIASYYAPADKKSEWASKSFKEIVGLMLEDECRLHGPADSFLSEVAMGQYRMLCKLPYIGVQSTMMQSAGECGWKGSIVTGGGPFDGLASAIGMNIAWNSPVTWSTSNMAQFTPLKSSFTIFNDTFEHFITNYAFIMRFMATTKAVTDFMFIRSPYLYDVEIPGGVRYQLCSCTASISHIGKIRKMFPDSKCSTVATIMKRLFNLNINPVAMQYVPDAYTVSLDFRSLLPDLWNFADSYLCSLPGRESENGTQAVKAMGTGGYLTGDTIGTKLTAFVDKLAEAMK